MTHKEIIKKSILRGLPYSQELNNIITPLRTIGITDFAYQIKKNGYRKTTLITNHSFIEEYGQQINQYPESAFFEKNDRAPEADLSTSKLYESVKNPITQTMEKHGIKQWVLLKNNNDFDQNQEFFWFCSNTKNSNFIGQLTNNLEDLHHFMIYLKDRGKKMIEASTLSEAEIPETKPARKIIPPKQAPLHFEIQNYHLGYPFKTHLTTQEFLCLKFFYMGLTAKEIGKELLISPRTIEKYLASVRKKIDLPPGKTVRQALLSCQVFMRLMHAHGECLINNSR